MLTEKKEQQEDSFYEFSDCVDDTVPSVEMNNPLPTITHFVILLCQNK